MRTTLSLIAGLALGLSLAAPAAQAAAVPAQLSNLTVQSVAIPLVGPGYTIVASRDENPCILNPRPGTACPAVVIERIYDISVTSSTRVLAKDRTPLSGMIRAGDTINAYGPLAGTNMTAQIVRQVGMSTTPIPTESDLKIKVTRGRAQFSEGRKYTVRLEAQGGMGPYRWTAQNLPPGMALRQDVINCITAPCPQPSNEKVRLTGRATTAGTYLSRIVVTDALGASSQLEIPFVVR